MMPGKSFAALWYYYLPDLILAALIWLLIARLVLSLVLGPNSANTAVRVLGAVTKPVLAAVGAITPRLLPAGLVTACAIAWLLAARIALFVAVSAKGVRLSMG
jgi:hypothetical protein